MRFTLITEGISENRIIKHIISKTFKDDDIYFRDAQPQIVNDKQETNGGWSEVLKYCERKEDLQEIFRNTDYLIIQIDTDLSQIKPFEVSHYTDENVLKSEEDLYLDVLNKLTSVIDKGVFDKYGSKIMFAICIHSIECWLLPLHYTNHHKSDTRNCLSTLNKALNRQNHPTISVGSKNGVKSVKAYDNILKAWRKKEDIVTSAENSISFKCFIDALLKLQNGAVA